MLKFFKNAGIILLFVLSITQLYDWYTKSKEGDLVATASYGFLRLPDSLNYEFSRIYSLCSRQVLDSLLSDYRARVNENKSRDVVDETIREMSYELRQRVPSGLPYEFATIGGYWAVVVRNEGNKLIKDAVLTLPNTIRLSIRRMGEESRESSSGDVVRLGNLQPTEEVVLFAWTNIAPSRLYFDQVRIVHDAGVGTVTFLAPVGSFGQWMDANYGFIVYTFVFVIVVIGIAYGLALLESKSKTQNTKPNAAKQAGASDELKT